MRDLYEILGVAHDATADQIREAFVEISKEKHPDRGGDTTAFQEITQAYRILKDPDARAHYDATGNEAENEKRNLRDQAIVVIDMQIEAILQNPDAKFVNWIQAMKDFFAEQKSEREKSIVVIGRRTEYLTDMMNRFVVKGEGENLLARMVRRRLEANARMMENLAEESKVHQTAIEMLNGYGFTQASRFYYSPTHTSSILSPYSNNTT